MSKQFHLGDILSITTGRLLSTRHMDGIYEILNYMTGDSLFTHQLGRASEECKPWLLRQLPQLAKAVYPDPNPSDPMEWMREQCAIYGDTLPVEPIPADDHERKNPIDELVEMVGPEKVVVVSPKDIDE